MFGRFGSSADAPQIDRELVDQINKRLTLNLLIQGAAAHTFTTANHLVKEDLEAIRPGLTHLYDRFAISGQLNYCIGEIALTFGRPNRWWGWSRTPQKPFRNHPLMAKHGNRLATGETRRLQRLARTKGVIPYPMFHWLQFWGILFKVTSAESGNASRLEPIAIRAASEIWNIPAHRLDGSITRDVAFGNLREPKTGLGKMTRAGVVGYGGVERRGDQFTVVAKAWVFPLLIHELVKGIMELICLHGLNKLDESAYDAVTEEADQLEYEAWLLQAGPEMWRQFLAVAPREPPLANTVMNVAKLAPTPLHELMIQVIEAPDRAAKRLAELSN
ncbi:MAG: hypothetical protein HKN47_14950 [Pirellulaceae bacterium]|nr:hypothetical protein [Pirellulaceae bacterium]